MLLTNVGQSDGGGVLTAIKKYESHPSIVMIREHVVIDVQFEFSSVSYEDMYSELKRLDTKKGIPFMDIPLGRLKEVADIMVEPVMGIWNNEIILDGKFPSKLKLADVTAIFKKLESITKEN